MVMVSPTGWVARFEERVGERLRITELPVERFSDDWNALVVDRSHGVLTVAKRRSGFVELAECGRSSAVVASPPGWRVVSQEDDAEWSEPILAWIVADSGVGQPMIADRVSGYIACAEDFSAKYALWGPDDPEPPTTVTGCAQQK